MNEVPSLAIAKDSIVRSRHSDTNLWPTNVTRAITQPTADRSSIETVMGAVVLTNDERNELKNAVLLRALDTLLGKQELTDRRVPFDLKPPLGHGALARKILKPCSAHATRW